jgi:alpha-D-xyloside xylohydrolase
VDIRVDGAGTIAVTIGVDGAAVVSQSFIAEDGERFLGFGERSHAVSLDRGVVENYVGEGPYQPHEYPFLTDTVPPWGIRNRPDATYFPLPWVLSTRGYGLSIDQDDLSYVRLRVDSPDRWSIEAEAGHLSYTVYAGPTPLEALRRYTAATGRQPAPARWFFGPWYQSGHANHVPLEEERRQLDALSGAPASAVETHCRYLPLGEDRGHEDEERARTAFFHSRGLAALSYINPLVGEEYGEAFEPAARAGVLQRDGSGRPYLFRAYAGGRVPPHTNETQYDFSTPRTAPHWAGVAERIVAAGYDGWMEDFGEYTPLDVVASDGSTGVAAHNRYPTDYHRAAATVAEAFEQRYRRRLARFVRSGWTGTAAVAPIVWGGDPTTSWGLRWPRQHGDRGAVHGCQRRGHVG